MIWMEPIVHFALYRPTFTLSAIDNFVDQSLWNRASEDKTKLSYSLLYKREW